MTDAQWECLAPLIPAAKPGGRPRKTDMRAAMNAIFYLLRTGCPWRYLPRGLFPPRSTVYNIFRQFQRDDAWKRIWEELHMALREALGHEASPTAAIIDSQSLKAAEKGSREPGQEDAVGYDAVKEGEGPQAACPGRCRRLAAARDRPFRRHTGPRWRSPRSRQLRQRFPWLELVWANSGYTAHQVKDAVARSPGLRLEIVKRTDDIKGFVVLPRRSIVERTFSWFGRNRRLAKDYENLADTLAAFVTLAVLRQRT